MIPGEQETAESTQAELRLPAANLSRLISLVATFIERAGVAKTRIPRRSGLALLGLATKTMRLGRCVQILAVSGFEVEAFALTRTMVESLAAMTFLSKRSVRIISRTKGGKPRPAKVPRIRPLSAEFRAMLFFAKSALTQIRMTEEAVQIGGLKRLLTKSKLQEYRAARARVRREIGPEWEAALWKSNTCAGVPISSLLATAFRGSLHSKIVALHYPAASRVAHANDIDNYVSESESGDFVLAVPSANDCRFAMGHAEILLLLVADILNSRFGLRQDDLVTLERERIDAELAAEEM